MQAPLLVAARCSTAEVAEGSGSSCIAAALLRPEALAPSIGAREKSTGLPQLRPERAPILVRVLIRLTQTSHNKDKFNHDAWDAAAFEFLPFMLDA
jgi:hypothetical protein